MQTTRVARQTRCGRCGNDGHNKRNRRCPMYEIEKEGIRRVLMISDDVSLRYIDRYRLLIRIIQEPEYREVLQQNSQVNEVLYRMVCGWSQFERQIEYEGLLSRRTQVQRELTKTVLKSIPVTIGVFEEESYDCSICLNTCERMSVAHTNCKHAFCLVCVCDYTNSIKDKTTKPNCPLCRTELSTLKVSCEEKKQVLHTHFHSL
jgi:hypothetical protein